MTLREIAELLATTTGAIKAALHRGRGRLHEPEGAAASRRPLPSPELIDRFIERYNVKDMPGLVALLLDGGSAENVGNSFHLGADPKEGTPAFSTRWSTVTPSGPVSSSVTRRAVGEALGVRVRTGIYRAPTPAPGTGWPDPAFPRSRDPEAAPAAE